MTVGIYASGSSSANIITVSGNTVYSNSNYGIYGSMYTLISGNVAHSHTQSGGIGIYGCDWAVVTGNKAYNNTNIGISIAGNTGYYRFPRASGNIAYSNGTGILASAFIELANNICYANSTSGITLAGQIVSSYRPSHIRNNTIHQPAGTGILLLSDAKDVALRNNIISAGGAHAIKVTSEASTGAPARCHVLISDCVLESRVLWRHCGRHIPQQGDAVTAAGKDLRAVRRESDRVEDRSLPADGADASARGGIP